MSSKSVFVHLLCMGKPYQAHNLNTQLQGWTWFEDSKWFVVMTLRELSNISLPNRLIGRKYLWLSAWEGENHVAFEIRLGRELTLFKDVKQFCFDDLQQALKYLPKHIGSKNVFVYMLWIGKNISSSVSKQKGNGLGLKTSKVYNIY